MADVYGAPKRPKLRQRPKVKKARRDYKSRRDDQGQYATTDRSVASRRYIRTLRRKSDRKITRKRKSDIYNAKGGLKSQKRRRAARRKKK